MVHRTPYFRQSRCGLQNTSNDLVRTDSASFTFFRQIIAWQMAAQTATASLSKWRPRPPLHRSANGGPDRHCIAQLREGAFSLITAPAFAVLPCFRLQISPRATAGDRHAEVATNNE